MVKVEIKDNSKEPMLIKKSDVEEEETKKR